MRQSLQTNDKFVRIQLVEDPALIAECRSKIVSEGALFVCYRCRDTESSVAAILVMNEDPEECYAICGDCLRDLPEGIDA